MANRWSPSSPFSCCPLQKPILPEGGAKIRSETSRALTEHHLQTTWVWGHHCQVSAQFIRGLHHQLHLQGPLLSTLLIAHLDLITLEKITAAAQEYTYTPAFWTNCVQNSHQQCFLSGQSGNNSLGQSCCATFTLILNSFLHRHALYESSVLNTKISWIN